MVARKAIAAGETFCFWDRKYLTSCVVLPPWKCKSKSQDPQRTHLAWRHRRHTTATCPGQIRLDIPAATCSKSKSWPLRSLAIATVSCVSEIMGNGCFCVVLPANVVRKINIWADSVTLRAVLQNVRASHVLTVYESEKYRTQLFRGVGISCGTYLSAPADKEFDFYEIYINFNYLTALCRLTSYSDGIWWKLLWNSRKMELWVVFKQLIELSTFDVQWLPV